MGGCCAGFETPAIKGRLSDDEPRQFIECLRQKFVDLGMDPDADPLSDVYAPKDKYLDANSDATRPLADAAGFTRLSCPLSDHSAILSRTPAIY